MTPKVIVILPGQPAEVAELGPPFRPGSAKTIGLRDLYSVCGSPVEVVPLAPSIDLWCNEEGRLNGMPPNVLVGPHRVYGPCLIARHNADGDTIGLTARDIARWLPIAESWPRYVTNPAQLSAFR